MALSGQSSVTSCSRGARIEYRGRLPAFGFSRSVCMCSLMSRDDGSLQFERVATALHAQAVEVTRESAHAGNSQESTQSAGRCE